MGATAVRGTQSVPTSYEDFFSQYYPFIRRIVQRAGILPSEVDDVSMSIVSKFFENGVLEDYDPERVTIYQGQPRKAMFTTFLSGFVHIYLRHYVDRQRVRQHREPCSLSSEQGAVISASAASEDSYDNVVGERMIEAIRTHLVATDDGSLRRCSLVQLFEIASRNALSGDRVRVSDLAREIGVSETTVRSRMELLYAEVRQVLLDWS